MDKWLMVVIGWGIVGPILAIGVCYVIPMANGQRVFEGLSALWLTALSAPSSLAASHEDGSQEPHVRRGEESLAPSHLADALTAARAIGHGHRTIAEHRLSRRRALHNL